MANPRLPMGSDLTNLFKNLVRDEAGKPKEEIMYGTAGLGQNQMRMDMRQITEKQKTTNFQQLLREATENYEYFHILCKPLLIQV